MVVIKKAPAGYFAQLFTDTHPKPYGYQNVNGKWRDTPEESLKDMMKHREVVMKRLEKKRDEILQSIEDLKNSSLNVRIE